jgi:hypothetical protein
MSAAMINVGLMREGRFSIRNKTADCLRLRFWHCKWGRALSTITSTVAIRWKLPTSRHKTVRNLALLWHFLVASEFLGFPREDLNDS